MIEKEPESRSDEAGGSSLHDQLDKLIQEYFKKIFKDNNTLDDGDYIASWAIVVNYGNIDQNQGMASGYSVETMPIRNPPHATKGLLREGIDWILAAQDGAFSDDEEY